MASITISPDTATWHPLTVAAFPTATSIAEHLQSKKVEVNLITQCHKLNTLSESYFRRLNFAQELFAPSQPWTTMIHGDIISTAAARD